MVVLNNAFINLNDYISVTHDHKIIRQHQLHPGDDLELSHSSSSPITFCGLALPFTSDQLHITVPTDPAFKDVVR